MPSIYDKALAELGSVFARIDDRAVERALSMIAEAKRIVVFGGGRERLQIMGFAMRLYHMGLAVAVEGDMTTPPVGKGDLFIVTVGPGEISTALALLGVAKLAGATILVLTIPAQTMADDQGAKKTSTLPMGSLYEGALFVLFEVMILKLRDNLKIAPELMRANHTNLE